MGASKRLCELCLQALFANQKAKMTKFSMVRFGNVLDSSGSVIPKFRQQIKERIPITLISRCQRYDLSRVKSEELFVYLKNITLKEKKKCRG